MKSIQFSFGDETITQEGKGLDMLLDAFLERKVTGQGGFDYEIVETRPDIIGEVLNDRYGYNDPGRVLSSYSFYTLFLNMNVKINDPDTWSLSWARFNFEIDGYNTSVISFAPDVNGVKTTIEKNGSRELNVSLSGEIKPALSAIDAKASSNVNYDKNNGWTVKYEDYVEEVKGYKSRTDNGKISLQWDIYRNNAIKVPQSNIGVTSGICASAIIGTPKKSEVDINVKVSGETLHTGISIRSRGIIELSSAAKFTLEPTL